MSKVSTRPQKTATPVANATTAVAEAPNAGTRLVIESPADHWRPAAIQARNAVAKLALDAQQIDEEERADSRGMAKRLMSLVVSDLGETSEDADKALFEHAFFNAEALIYAALTLPADSVGLKVESKLRHALVIIDKTTDHLCGGLEVHRVFDAIRKAPVEIPQKRDPLHRHSPAQAALAFERIASMADTAVDTMLATDSVHGAQLIVEYIGALADSMIGEAIIGRPASWAVGMPFVKAAQP